MTPEEAAELLAETVRSRGRLTALDAIALVVAAGGEDLAPDAGGGRRLRLDVLQAFEEATPDIVYLTGSKRWRPRRPSDRPGRRSQWLDAADRLEALELEPPDAHALEASRPQEAFPALLDTKTAARFLGYSPAVLRRLDVEQQIPRPLRIGRGRRWSRTELERWIDDGCQTRERWELEKRRSADTRRS